ncbi:MAG: hypothetical protein BGO77_04900 [Caedibacter sp. 37-49]|nr:MAG: hypothetical protein BGO77_04900 [Caedibacter sp. 37-49]
MSFFLRFTFILSFILGISVPQINASNPNKESFSLERNNFSSSTSIDYEGLESELRYHFKDRELLKAALRPLLKLDKETQALKIKFEHLEFYGDAVLGCFIRERLIRNFPQQERGDLDLLYQSLTGNKTLAELYLRSLPIEQYLPFPEKGTCKYCNLVEALIGAISLDDPVNGSLNARKFIMFVINDHVLAEKIAEISKKKLMTIPKVLPHVSDALTEVCKVDRINSANPKSLLQEILSIAWMDCPTYFLTVSLDHKGFPILRSVVSGAQIGRDLSGEGFSRQSAEENAARKAINFLAKRDLYPQIELNQRNQTCWKLLKEFNDFKQSEGCEVLRESQDHRPYWLQYSLNNIIIGEGSGRTEEEAKEKAAEQAVTHLLLKRSQKKSESSSGSKNFRQLLKEFNDQYPNHKIELITKPDPTEGFICEAQEGTKKITEAIGVSKDIAKENAAEKVYALLKQDLQEKPLKQEAKMNFRAQFNQLRSQLHIVPASRWTYTHFLLLDSKTIPIADNGQTAKEARENASLKTLRELIKIEQENNQLRPVLQRSRSVNFATPKLPAPAKRLSAEILSAKTADAKGGSSSKFAPLTLVVAKKPPAVKPASLKSKDKKKKAKSSSELKKSTVNH